MRIAIQNTYYGKQFAEAELSRRLALAAMNLGWDAVEVGSSEAINQCHPDFVLNLHFRSPKLTRYPTYGCLWNPTVLIETDDRFIRNILSYDAYLSSSKKTDLWLADQLYNTPKRYFIAPFFTSTNQTVYRAPNLQSPRLAYVGTNWDGERFKSLFLALEKEGILETYGSSSSWSYLKTAYKGTLPFDGISVLNAINAAGVGLCLHRQEHTQEGIPSMRIFEIVASGAIAICGEHPFIRDQFSDTVLYLDTHLNLVDQVTQIAEHLHWVSTHPQTALEMSQAAHHIFTEKFTLEKLLSNLQDQHQQLLETKGFVQHYSLPQTHQLSQKPSVQLILRIQKSNLSKLKKTLDSIQKQTYQNLSILIVNNEKSEEVSSTLKDYQAKLPIHVIQSEISGFSRRVFRSNELWSGIRAVSAEYFGVLDQASIIYPNHIHTLVSILERFKHIGMAYSEVIELSEKEVIDPVEVFDQASLATVQSSNLFNWLGCLHFITVSSFLARSSLIDEFLLQDPQLNYWDDFFLWLNLRARCNVMFSYEATCEIDSRNSVSAEAPCSEELNVAIERIQTMMQDRKLPTMSSFAYHSVQTRLQQTQIELQHAQQRIAAMESSKFWLIRKHWLKLKRALGLTREL